MSIAEAEDEEVSDLGFAAWDVGKVMADAEGSTEGRPLSEDGVAGFVGLADVGSARDLQSRAEVSREVVSGRSCRSDQALRCG